MDKKEEDNSTKFYMYHLSGESGVQLAVDKCLTVNEDRTWTLLILLMAERTNVQN